MLPRGLNWTSSSNVKVSWWWWIVSLYIKWLPVAHAVRAAGVFRQNIHVPRVPLCGKTKQPLHQPIVNAKLHPSSWQPFLTPGQSMWQGQLGWPWKTPLGFPSSQVATQRRSKGGMVEGISKWHHEGSCPGFLVATLLGECRLGCNPHVCHQPWPLVDVAFYDKASSPNQAQSSRMFSSCMNHDKGRSDWLSDII